MVLQLLICYRIGKQVTRQVLVDDVHHAVQRLANVVGIQAAELFLQQIRR